MNCYYCDKIVSTNPGYAASPASHDLGSGAPRCSMHWRYVCGSCGKPAHFMASGYCQETGQFFCANCSSARGEVIEKFWAWSYYFSYRSPWTGAESPSLDRLEYEGRHPLQVPGSTARASVSQEEYLIRYPFVASQWHVDENLSDADVQRNWNRNAERWDAGYDDDGDRNRRYQSDEPMLAMLGDVRGKRVLDVGSGNGYLCRKLARAGAQMTGVELSDEFIKIAMRREASEKLGIAYVNASASKMDFLPGSSFDKAVSNYVLMDIRDYTLALGEVFRVLKTGGVFIVVISHPAFDSVPGVWLKPAPDSPRVEDRSGWLTDRYFYTGPLMEHFGNFDPILSFHRPLREYWRAFKQAGFVVDGFEEPSITERGRRELSPVRVEHALRIPYSCIFRLVKPA
ncbi:MAG: methyltransferase domain-containing protein [Chloroflexi bacterium]|nr:methyltransferase domain-containing protein [Chloroflexota bacterium]